MSNHIQAYRSLLRQLRKSTATPRKVNRTIMDKFRSMIAKYHTTKDGEVLRDIESATLFLKSNREHKLLLERYNPLFDLTSQERVAATARRVGLNMPKLAETDKNE